MNTYEPNSRSSIAIADHSALFFLLHSDAGSRIERNCIIRNENAYSAPTRAQTKELDVDHPSLGGRPVTILVQNNNCRSHTSRVKCASCAAQLPSDSFFRLRSGLNMATPELVYARMGLYLNEYQLVQIGINLCARYFIKIDSGKIEKRNSYLTNPHQLANYIRSAHDIKGSSKAFKALKWVLPNSGSPEETRTYLQYCLPFSKGGFSLPLNLMNYDVHSGKLLGISEQDNYSIDLCNADSKIAIEYDGVESHENVWRDIRRRNELGILGWRIFPINKQVLYNPEAAIRFGLQMLKITHKQDRRPASWYDKFELLRNSIGLPT